jgi:hypothetical protein
MRFQFANDPGQSRSIVMDLRFLHPPLSIFITEKLKNRLKGPLGIVRHIGECSPLLVREEHFQ